MTRLMNSDLRKFAIALTIGVLSAGYSTVASAASTYDTSAGLTVTLTDVTNLSGAAVSIDDWNVIIEILSPSTYTGSTGDGSASASTTSSFEGLDFLEIGDFVNQTATSNGTVTNGTVNSNAFIGVYYQGLYNSSAQALRFSFDYDMTVIASAAGDDSVSGASVSILDFPEINIMSDANANNIMAPFVDQSASGSFFIDVDTGGFTQMTTALNISGSANSVIPVPAAVWLFCSGLLGLVGVARRKKS